jgi:hypothetical protein
MPDYHYPRHVRTPYSEGFEIYDGQRRLGHIDFHYGPEEVYSTLILEQKLDEDDLLTLIEKIDDDLVLSSGMPRQDFLVNVYHGTDVGLYNDDFMRERVAGRASVDTSGGPDA